MATYNKVPAEVSQTPIIRRKPVARLSKATSRPAQKGTSPYVSILLLSLALILPAIILPTILLCLVTTNTRSVHDPWFRAERDGYLTDTNAYYVGYSASRLLTIASWASTVAPFLATLCMALLVFHSARQFRRYSTSQQSRLPTPYQLGLTLSGLAAELGTTWRLFSYLTFWKERRKLGRISMDVFTILAVVWIIGYGIIGVDTWLHVTTSAVQMLVPKAESAINGTNGWSVNYTINPDSSDGLFDQLVYNYNTFFNSTADSRVLIGTDGNRTFAYLSNPLVSTDQDFRATTIGAETTCKFVNQYCTYGNINSTGTTREYEYQFNCSWGLTDYASLFDQTDTPSAVGVSAPQQGSAPVWETPPYGHPVSSPNAYDYTVWGLFSPSDNGIAPDSPLHNDVQFVAVYQFNGWFANCSTTRYVLNYTWTDGQFHLDGEPSSINLTFYNRLQASYFSGRVAFIVNAVNTGQELLNTYASYASQLFVADTAGKSNQTLNSAETDNVLGARVIKAPFYLLIILNYLFVILGVSLTVLALCSEPKQVQDIVNKLNIYGVIAARFEPQLDGRPARGSDELYSEGSEASEKETARIGFSQSHREGWKYELHND